MDRIDTRVAVVGAGYWGKNFVRHFASTGTLHICCDTSTAVRDWVRRDYPTVRVTASFEKVLDDPAVQGVVIATPAVSHAPLAELALAAGKDVFVEKPLALRLDDGERLVELAQTNARILMVGHLLEYHPAVAYLRTMLQRGELGEVYYCYSHRVNLGRVRSDENALWSLAPHDISIVLHLFGEEPVEVHAVGQSFLQPGVEDVVFLTLRFGSDRLAHIQVSWLDPHKERRLTVVGSKKMVVFDDMQPREKLKVYDKGFGRTATETPASSEFLTVREGDIVIPFVSAREPLAIECTAFLEAITTRVPAPSDGHDGLRVLRVLHAAQESMARLAPTIA